MCVHKYKIFDYFEQTLMNKEITERKIKVDIIIVPSCVWILLKKTK